MFEAHVTSGFVMASIPKPKEFIAAKYMTRFSCLGPDCEDNCCHSWLVGLERDDYMRMRKALSVDQEGKEAFEHGVKRLRGEEKKEWYAALEHRPDGSCVFLAKEGLCTMHRDYGEKALCYVCSTYPRSVPLVGDRRIELTGTLSCPEIARLCLLADDAMELVDFDPAVLPRNRTMGAIDVESDDPYYRYFDDVRATVLGLLAVTEYPAPTRLFFVTYFAHRLDDFFGPGNENFSEGRLASEIDHISNADNLDELHRQFQELEIPTDLTSTLTQQLLAARVHRGVHRKFALMVRDAYFSYLGIDPNEWTESEDTERPSLTSDELWPMYRERAEFWDERFPDRIDQYITNYALNYWVKSWYTASPSLLRHTRTLLISVAALRFLLFSDPTLATAVAHTDQSDEERRQLLDDTVVKVAYLFTRNVEHNKTFLDDVSESLDKRGISSFAHVVCLLKC